MPHVAEIIAIDSTSTDGTSEVLQEKLAPLGAELISTGPGLYKAWNQAVSLANQPYVYFSTIGDIISLPGLQKLVGWAEESSLDVVISSPRMINEDGSDNTRVKWPIHFLNRSSLRADGLHLPLREERYLLANLFFPESIIGSSASNLYRTEALKSFPFPEDIGSEGDVLWSANNLKKLKVGITTDKLASFCWDGDRTKSYAYIANKTEQIHSRLSIKCMSDDFPGGLYIDAMNCLHASQKRINKNLSSYESLINRAHRIPFFKLGLKYVHFRTIFWEKYNKSIIHRFIRVCRLVWRFYLPRLIYRIKSKQIGLLDPLLIMEAFHGMQLGKYEQYEPRPICFDLLPSSDPSDAPFIAIVTPSYNQSGYLEDTIKSILDQEYPRLSYAVADGGSKDDSPQIIAKYAGRLAYACSEKDQGQSDAIVKGFSKVEGEIMAYLNSDDLLAPGALRLVGEFFAHNPDVDVVYGHRIIIDAAGKEVGRWILPPHDNKANRYFDYIPQETMFWRRSLYEAVGGIDPRLQFTMDWDLILKFQAQGAKFVRLPYFLGCFRAHGEQKSQMQSEIGLNEVKSLIRTRGGDETFGAEYQSVHRRFRRRAMMSMLRMAIGIRK
jgi:glycosyltransferase involved in cell wall biosynthesis